MKTSFLAAAAALSFLTTPVSAIADMGFVLPVKTNPNGDCKTTADFTSDFSVLTSASNIVRIYSTSDCNQLQMVLPAVKAAGIKIILGVWPTDDAHYALEKAALQQYLTSDYFPSVIGVTVGSEALYRGDLTAAGLVAKISDIQSTLSAMGAGSIPVGTADSWNEWVDGANNAVIQASDLFLANAFPFWQGVGTDNMTQNFFDDVMQALQMIQGVKGTNNVNFWVGEAGWPTAGDTYENAQATVQVAGQFYTDAICAIRKWGVSVFMFEYMDETWKPITDSDTGVPVNVETHFGVFSNDPTPTPKYNINC